VSGPPKQLTWELNSVNDVFEPVPKSDSLFDAIAARSGNSPVRLLSPGECERAMFKAARPLLNGSGLPLVMYVIGENCVRELGRAFRKHSGPVLRQRLAELEVKYVTGALPQELFRSLVGSCFDALKDAERRRDGTS